MHASIANDQYLRELALSEARNAVGPDEPMPVFLSAECLTQAEYDEIAKNKVYRGYVKEYTAELKEKGFGFAAKARVLAEDLLADVYRMAKDTDTPAAIRVKTLENLVEWGQLVPKVAKGADAGAGFSVTINLGAQNEPRSITIDAQTPEHAPTPVPNLLADLLNPVPLDVDLYYEAEAQETLAGSLTSGVPV
jgi:hypothetical protein